MSRLNWDAIILINRNFRIFVDDGENSLADSSIFYDFLRFWRDFYTYVSMKSLFFSRLGCAVDVLKSYPAPMLAIFFANVRPINGDRVSMFYVVTQSDLPKSGWYVISPRNFYYVPILSFILIFHTSGPGQFKKSPEKKFVKSNT